MVLEQLVICLVLEVKMVDVVLLEVLVILIGGTVLVAQVGMKTLLILEQTII